MSSFQEIVTKSYSSYEELLQDVQEMAKQDDFVMIKKSTNRNEENAVLKGIFKCYKSGVSVTRDKSRGTTKTDCGFNLHFRRHQATSIYSFTSTYHLTHNHALNHNSTTMTPLARRFVPSQADLIDSMHSSGLPVSQIVTELRGRTNVIVQNKNVYNALQPCKRTQIDGLSQVQELLSALDGNAEFAYKVSADRIIS